MNDPGPGRRVWPWPRCAAVEFRCSEFVDLVVLRNGQRVFNEVIDSYLRRVQFAPDGYARVITLPVYRVAEVVVDPARGFGQPVYARGGANGALIKGSLVSLQQYQSAVDHGGVSRSPFRPQVDETR
jgi:hypothetical protein